MKFPTKLAKTLIAAAGVIAFAGSALADQWPSRPITMIVPYNAGGTTDNLARQAADAISDALGQPVIVENKPGAGGIVGTTIAAQAKNDGYTIFFGNNATNVVQPLINPAVQYDAKESFDGIATIADAAVLLGVSSTLGVANLDEFIAYLKKNPKTKFGSAGVGSMGQFSTEYLLQSTGTDAKHIPYQGSNNALTAILANEIQFMTDPAVIRQASSDKIKVLATLTDARHPNLPDVPTAKELGHEIVLSGWFGVFAPEGTDAAAIAAMSAPLKTLVASPEFQKQVLSMGLLPAYRDPATTNAVVETDLGVFGKIRDIAGISIE